MRSDQLVGNGEVVFIDKGKTDGIQKGNRLHVVRRGDAYSDVMTPGQNTGQDDSRYPSRSMGQIIVVDVAEETATAVVLSAVQEFGVGDQVLLREGK